MGEGAVVPNDVVRVRIDPSVRTFFGRRKLEEVQLHDGLREIGREAFQYCTALNDIVIPPGLREIGYGAFSDCTSLTKVHVSDGIESIGPYAFYYCNSHYHNP